MVVRMPRQQPAWIGRSAAPYVLITVLAFLAIGLWAYLVAQVVDAADGAAADRREDVVAYYAAGWLLQEGRIAALYDPDAVAEAERVILGRPAGHHGGLAYMNPPFVAGLFRPLAHLPYEQAQAVWFGLTAVAVLASLALLWPELRTLPRRWAAVFVLAAIASFPVFWSFLYGQISPLVLLSWVLFYRGLKSGRSGMAGLALAGMLIKPQLVFAPALFLVATRRWRALGGTAVAAAALAGGSVLLAGPEATFVAYPRFLLESLSWQAEYGVDRPHMFGWSSFLPLLLPGAPRGLLLVAAGVLSVVTLVLAATVWRRHADGHCSSQPMFALAAATILTSPHIHAQDLGLLILPSALLVAYRRNLFAVAVPVVLFFLTPAVAVGVNLVTPALAVALAAVAWQPLRLWFASRLRRPLVWRRQLRFVGRAPETAQSRTTMAFSGQASAPRRACSFRASGTTSSST